MLHGHHISLLVLIVLCSTPEESLAQPTMLCTVRVKKSTSTYTSVPVPFKGQTNAAEVTVKCRTSDGLVPPRYPCEFCTSEQRAHAIVKWRAEQSRGISRYLLTHSLERVSQRWARLEHRGPDRYRWNCR